jgi:hypothetical protein
MRLVRKPYRDSRSLTSWQVGDERILLPDQIDIVSGEDVLADKTIQVSMVSYKTMQVC